MAEEMHEYYYEGPVVVFGRVVADNWFGSTRAKSIKKAKSNLIFQFKKQSNREVSTKVELTGEVKEVD